MFLNEKQKVWLWEFWHGHERLIAEEAKIICEMRSNPDLLSEHPISIQKLIRWKIRDMYKCRFPNARKVQIPLPKKHSDVEDSCATLQAVANYTPVVYATKQEPDTMQMRPDFEGLMAKAIEEAYISGGLSLVQGMNKGKIPDYKNDAKAHAQKSIAFLKGGVWPF